MIPLEKERERARGRVRKRERKLLGILLRWPGICRTIFTSLMNLPVQELDIFLH